MSCFLRPLRINFKQIRVVTDIFLNNFIEIDVSWVLDAKKTRNPRLFFVNEEGKNIRNSTMRLNIGKTECRTERVYIAVSSANIFTMAQLHDPENNTIFHYSG